MTKLTVNLRRLSCLAEVAIERSRLLIQYGCIIDKTRGRIPTSKEIYTENLFATHPWNELEGIELFSKYLPDDTKVEVSIDLMNAILILVDKEMK